MNRLTTDHPQNNFETVMNLVYGKDGWQYIRHGETEMRTTDFCLMLCKERGCTTLEHPMNDEEKDEFLCDCVFNGCPIATIYAALSGFGHVRARLKMYEDTGLDMLTLPIKKCWFDMIVSGVKNEEYRDCTAYYLKRFHHLKMTMADGKAQTFIRLRNGYGRNAPSCLIRCWIDMGEGRVEWGATPGKQYIRLHITKVNVERRNND